MQDHRQPVARGEDARGSYWDAEVSREAVQKGVNKCCLKKLQVKNERKLTHKKHQWLHENNFH